MSESESGAPTAVVATESAAANDTGGLLGGIVRLNLAVSDVFERITAPLGLGMSDYLVLGVIRGAPGSRTSPSSIAATIDRTSGGMTLTLDRLVSAGLVRRSRDPQDGRRVVVELTTDGLDLALRINRALHRWEQGLALPADPDDVVRIVDGLTDAVRRHQPAP